LYGVYLYTNNVVHFYIRKQECFKDSPDIVSDVEETVPIITQQFRDSDSFMNLTEEELENIQTLFDLTVFEIWLIVR